MNLKLDNKSKRAVCLISGTALYLILGAFIFSYFEYENELRVRSEIFGTKQIMQQKYNFTTDDFHQLEKVVVRSIPFAAGFQWKFIGAFYFCTIVITTIGYGHSTPYTFLGKVFCILFALVGIPLSLVMFQSVGERFNYIIRCGLIKIGRFLSKRNINFLSEVKSCHLLIVSFTVGTLTIIVSTIVFHLREKWSLFDAYYYCVITLSTIGLGDYVPLQTKGQLQQDIGYVIFTLFFILFGLAIFSACVNLLILEFMAYNADIVTARTRLKRLFSLRGTSSFKNSSFRSGLPKVYRRSCRQTAETVGAKASTTDLKNLSIKHTLLKFNKKLTTHKTANNIKRSSCQSNEKSDFIYIKDQGYYRLKSTFFTTCQMPTKLIDHLMEESLLLTSDPLQPKVDILTPVSNTLSESTDNEKRISQLEHEIFMVLKQLEETKATLKESNNQNGILKEHINTLESNKLESIKLVQVLEKSRNDLTVEKTQLQDSQFQLKSQKDSFEAEFNKHLVEKRRLTEDLQAAKSDYVQERKERSLLQAKIDEFEKEKSLIAYDKERWAREKEILVQGKQWCMKEISSRETKLNELRIETMKLESNINQEKHALSEERDVLSVKVEELNESLTKKERELTEIRNRLEKVIDERVATLNEIDSELRTKERLTELYKTSLDVANNEVATLKENETKLQKTLQENEMNIVNLNAELEKLTDSHEKETTEKDSLISKLNEELTRANELLKIQARAHRTDEEIAALSPAAAAASKLIRSGFSLTSIYAEHCRVVAELEKKTAENERIESYVTELIEELDAKAPLFREQREFYENSVEEIKRLNLQNKLFSENYQKIQNARDSLARELLFTKAELERYQHEHHALTLQVRRLLYNIERSNGVPDLDPETEEYLFSNIEELHAANLQSISKVKELEAQISEANSSSNITKLETLKVALQNAEKELERFRDNQARNELIVIELTAQRDNYKSLYENSSLPRDNSSPGANSVLLTLEKSSSDLQQWKSKVEALQEKLEYFSKDKQDSDRAFNDRIDQQLEQISQLRTTNGKLESALEFQKKNQQILTKSVDELEKELKKASDNVTKLNVRIESVQARNNDLANQVLVFQQEVSQLRILNHSLEEQLQVSRSNEQRACTELGVLRESSFNTDRVASTLQEVESVLKRVDSEKQNASNSQLQSACIERDNLKNLIEEVNVNHTQIINTLKSNINLLTSERDKAIDDLKILRESYTSLESHYKGVKEECAKLTSDSANIIVTSDDIGESKKEIQEMKTKIVAQENRIMELKSKCDELTKTVELKVNEVKKICALSTTMEDAVNNQNETIINKNAEVNLLKAQLATFAADLQAKNVEIQEKNNSLQKINSLLNQAKTLARNFRDSTNKLEKERELLKAELDKMKEDCAKTVSTKPEEKPAEGSTSWTNVCAENQAQQSAKLLLQQKISEIQKINVEKQELIAKIEELENAKLELEKKLVEISSELEEANEKCFRLDSITSMLQQSRKRCEQLTKQLVEKEVEIEDVKNLHSQSLSRKRAFGDIEPLDNENFESSTTNEKRSKPNAESDNFFPNETNFLPEEDRLILECSKQGFDNDLSELVPERVPKVSGDFLLDTLENEEIEEEDFDEDEEVEEEYEDYEDIPENSDDEEFNQENNLERDEHNASSEIICLSEGEDDDIDTPANVLQQAIYHEPLGFPPSVSQPLPTENSLIKDDQPSSQLSVEDIEEN